MLSEKFVCSGARFVADSAGLMGMIKNHNNKLNQMNQLKIEDKGKCTAAVTSVKLKFWQMRKGILQACLLLTTHHSNGMALGLTWQRQNRRRGKSSDKNTGPITTTKEETKVRQETYQNKGNSREPAVHPASDYRHATTGQRYANGRQQCILECDDDSFVKTEILKILRPTSYVCNETDFIAYSKCYHQVYEDDKDECESGDKCLPYKTTMINYYYERRRSSKNVSWEEAVQVVLNNLCQ
uniref:Uncharacterized protein n=1 Tax=Romanomermis culicivorax TaxID=13658 RepID=A0A915HZN8_ROMCU